MQAITQKLMGGFLTLVLVVGLTPASATAQEVDFGYGGDPVSCTLIATPDTIEVGGGTTLTWTLSSNVVSAVLKGKNSNSWMQNVALDGSWYISGILDSANKSKNEFFAANCFKPLIWSSKVLSPILP
jgi:hypothetical protein